MSVAGVHIFEMIKVDHHQAGGELRSPRPFHLYCERFFQISEVIEACERIDEGDLFESAAPFSQQFNFFHQRALF
jgi:hypothetical protein